MTIKHLGGIFGRNPTFNDAEVDGDLTINGESTFNNDITIQNDTAPKISILDSNNGFSAATLTSENGGRDLAIFAPQDIIFDQDGLETARFRDGGGLCFNGDTAAANALDDYEEGDWTATITSTVGSITSYSVNSAKYTKIGRLVTLNLLFAITDNGTGSGKISVAGAPYTAAFGTAGTIYNQSTGLMGVTSITSTTMSLRTATNTYPVATGQTTQLSITYIV